VHGRRAGECGDQAGSDKVCRARPGRRASRPRWPSGCSAQVMAGKRRRRHRTGLTSFKGLIRGDGRRDRLGPARPGGRRRSSDLPGPAGTPNRVTALFACPGRTSLSPFGLFWRWLTQKLAVFVIRHRFRRDGLVVTYRDMARAAGREAARRPPVLALQGRARLRGKKRAAPVGFQCGWFMFQTPHTRSEAGF